ncbi:MAG TPA: A24 family peptidase [Bryobacteraceae bacterium]|nr:A24 family peptidase [Bryobacteraceae bacterium]
MTGIGILIVLLVLPAAVFDIRSRRIPNWLVLAGALLGFALNWFLYGLAGLREAALGFALAFGVYFVFHALHAMGGGDVKLMAAIGSMVGPVSWLQIFLLTSVLGGVAALLLVAWRGRLRKTFWNVAFILSEICRFRAPYLSRQELDVRSGQALSLPHGAVVAVAALCFVVIRALYEVHSY